MRLQPWPHVVLVVIGRWIRIEDIRGLLPRWRVAPCFEKQNVRARARGEAVRHHATGGAAAHNDDIENAIHLRLLHPAGTLLPSRKERKRGHAADRKSTRLK